MVSPATPVPSETAPTSVFPQVSPLNHLFFPSFLLPPGGPSEAHLTAPLLFLPSYLQNGSARRAVAAQPGRKRKSNCLGTDEVGLGMGEAG